VIDGVQLVKASRHDDERGFFQRLTAVAFNRVKGTVRGLHWQVAPFEDAKAVVCLRGGIHDVLVDLRESSPTFGQSMAVELWDRDGMMLVVPAGIAHGYQTLTDETLVGYELHAPFSPEHARRAKWAHWPLPVSCISDADRSAP
jgi:dTDP-4-dehydrorhamnose 3,5-epimerase